MEDDMHEVYSPLALLTREMVEMPDLIKKRALKVFSKHTPGEVRQWGKMLSQNYHMLYAIEKPMDLSYVKPFSNTSDLIEKTPTLHEPEDKKDGEMGVKMENTIELESGQGEAYAAKEKKQSKAE